MMEEYLKEIKSTVSFNDDNLYSISKVICNSFLQKNLHNGHTIYEFSHNSGQLKNISIENFAKKLHGNETNSYTYEYLNLEKTVLVPTRCYCTDNTVLQIQYFTKNIHKEEPTVYINLVLLTTSASFINHIKELYKEYIIQEKDTSGDEIFLLKSDRTGVHLTSIGTVNTKYVADNYSSVVREKYSHLTEDLVNANPCGRLSIFSGEPGTGKTFLVKSLLSSGLNVSFVIVKPDAIESISDPSAVPALLEHHSMYDRPIIIVLEDADSCLTTRGGDNMGRLSAMLNTSDGILGSTLDIRIIATTNAKKVDFDPAILRPGRLCTHITTDKLTEEQADRIFTRLTGKSFMEAEVELTSKKADINLGFSGRSNKNPGYILAEIYKAAYDYNRVSK